MPTTYKFAPNVPATVDVKYIDIVPSEKGGPQVRFKGKIDGTENSYVYLPGKLTDQLTALIAGGIIASATYPTEVDKPFEIKPLKKQFQMMKEQLAGDKYGIFRILGPDGKAVSAASPATGTPAGAAGAAAPSSKSYADIYSKATDFIINTIVPKYRAAKLEPTATDVHAMVVTLFIPKSKEA